MIVGDRLHCERYLAHNYLDNSKILPRCSSLKLDVIRLSPPTEGSGSRPDLPQVELVMAQDTGGNRRSLKGNSWFMYGQKP